MSLPNRRMSDKMQAISRFLIKNLADEDSPSKGDKKSTGEMAGFSGLRLAAALRGSEISLSTLLPSLIKRIKPRPFSSKGLSDGGGEIFVSLKIG